MVSDSMFYGHFTKFFKSIPEKCMLIKYNIKYVPTYWLVPTHFVID